jgi:hypothetical protein
MFGYRIIFYVLLVVAVSTGVGTLGADMVILKSGEMFQTPRAWKENGMVHYYKDGRVVRVDEKAVDRLIQSAQPAKDQPSAEHRPATGPPSPSEAPAIGRSIPPPLPTGDSVGYLDLRWGQPLSQIEGLALVETDPAYGGVQQYASTKRQKRFGRASVDNIFYGFWQGGLYTILVETSTFLDFMDLKAEAFRRYGEVRQAGDHREKYRWTAKGSDRLLAYDSDSDTGFLWMRSQALHEKVKARFPE